MASDSAGPSEPSPSPQRTRFWTVFAAGACFFLLTSPGRMASSDAYTQLQAAIVLIQTGWVATDDPTLFDYCSVPAPSGRYYQAHDPGNIVLFTPAAVVAFRTGGADAARTVPLASRVAASLTYALVGAACISALYGALASIVPPPPALAAAALASVGTPLWIYARGTMDVLPAAFGAALTLWVLLAHAENRMTGGRAAVLAGFSLAIVVWFRVSVLPFLVLPTMIVLLRNETARPLRTLLVFALCLAACLTPVLIYNAIRSGSPFVLGTMHPRYDDQNGFAGKFGEGLYGLLISPNHGLLVFAPWLVLAFSPAALRACSPRARLALSALLIGVIAYTLLIAGLKQWAKVEWGPRYLVPVLPVIAISAGAAAYRLWKTRWRPLVAALAVVSIVPSAAAGVVNYSYVMTEFPGASDPLAPSPQQITGSYRALLGGLRGDVPMAPDKIRADPERAAGLRIPDYWTVRLWERGGIARVVGLAAVLMLLAGLIACLYRLLSRPTSSPHMASSHRSAV